MKKLRYLHGKVADLEKRLAKLQSLGFDVEDLDPDPKEFRGKNLQLPDLFVIDFSSRFSTSRDLAAWLRATKATRDLPMLFVDVDAKKKSELEKLFPDVVMVTWRGIRAGLDKALSKAAQPKASSKPSAAGVMAGYSGTPLPKKLGIKPNTTLQVISGPSDFLTTIGQLPEGVKTGSSLRGSAELWIWFPRNRADLEKRIDKFAERLHPGDGLWIAWPKQSSGVKTDLTQNDVRQVGLAAGIVDYKICAIDETYSGLKFSLRRTK